MRSALSCCATGSCRIGRCRWPSPAVRSWGVPLEITDALLAVFRYLADRHDRGYMVEHIMELLATS
jgi:hypothetical protein